ncbi:glycosyltransferase family 4 protein [Chitinophagaceae bacterium MMS25-I14]
MAQRITIITSSYPPEKGAAPSRIYLLAQVLQQRGYEVHVITAMPNYPTGRIFAGYRSKLWHKEVTDGIHIFRTWLYPSNSKNIFRRFASISTYTASLFLFALPRMFRYKPDLVIVNTPPFLTGYTGLLLARIAGSKALLNVSDIWPLSALELGAIRKGYLYNCLEWIERRMYHMANAFAGQSKEILEHISRISQKPSFLYYNLQPPSSPALSLPERKRRIVYAGLLGVAQGVYDICRNINFTELGTELHIYGDGYEKEQICSFITANPTRGLFYHGSVAAAEVPAILQEYDATLVPLKTAIHGALPSKIFMALANGLPVFFSAEGEGAAIVSGHNIGWVNGPEEFEILAQNIRSFTSMSPEEYNRIRQNCIYHASHTFNKQLQDDTFCAFIADIIKTNGAG